MEAKTSPKDVFLHLLSIVSLYTSGIAFLVLIFQYVNVLFPDAVAGDNYYQLESAYRMIRWSISSLIIVFPTYIIATWFLNKSYDKTPAKKKIWVRKWLVYFTLFVAALIIIGDLVSLINNLLNGELTMRFLLKVLAVFFVSGNVFYYYIWELKHKKAE
ncbi:MAG: DUF5671 domain-containing protein [bacterium]|nr:DUF5671 domain-containing protein [bacterium]